MNHTNNNKSCPQKNTHVDLTFTKKNNFLEEITEAAKNDKTKIITKLIKQDKSELSHEISLSNSLISNNIKTFKKVLGLTDNYNIGNIFVIGCENNRFEFIKLMFEFNCHISNNKFYRGLSLAIKGNHTDLILYLFTKIEIYPDPKNFIDSIEYACFNKKMEFIKIILFCTGCDKILLKHGLEKSSEYGDYDMVMYFYNELEKNVDTRTALENAIKGKHLKITKLFAEDLQCLDRLNNLILISKEYQAPKIETYLSGLKNIIEEAELEEVKIFRRVFFIFLLLLAVTTPYVYIISDYLAHSEKMHSGGKVQYMILVIIFIYSCCKLGKKFDMGVVLKTL